MANVYVNGHISNTYIVPYSTVRNLTCVSNDFSLMQEKLKTRVLLLMFS